MISYKHRKGCAKYIWVKREGNLEIWKGRSRHSERNGLEAAKQERDILRKGKRRAASTKRGGRGKGGGNERE